MKSFAAIALFARSVLSLLNNEACKYTNLKYLMFIYAKSYIILAAIVLPLACPDYGDHIYHSNSVHFRLECFFDRGGGYDELIWTNTWTDCIDACAAKSNCTNVAWVTDAKSGWDLLADEPGPCYLKNKLTDGEWKGNVWSARKVDAKEVDASEKNSSSCSSPVLPTIDSEQRPAILSIEQSFTTSADVSSVDIVASASASFSSILTVTTSANPLSTVSTQLAKEDST
jgi:hypothetical protein